MTRIGMNEMMRNIASTVKMALKPSFNMIQMSGPVTWLTKPTVS